MSDSIRALRSGAPNWRTIAIILGATSITGSGVLTSGMLGNKSSPAVDAIAKDVASTKTDVALLKDEQQDERRDRQEADKRIESKVDKVQESLDNVTEEILRGRPRGRR